MQKIILITIFMCSSLFAQIIPPHSLSTSFGGIGKSDVNSIIKNVDIDGLADAVSLNVNSMKAIKAFGNAPVVFASKSRGVKDAALFKTIAPSVVLIVSKDGMGTGSVINSSGEILTNWHVVGMNKEVSVIFKPERDTQKISKSDMRLAQVIKIDQESDLALVKVIEVPKTVRPIKLGSDNDIAIGLDVHAIGHPRGESWTYTKGVISQFRNDYRWSGGQAEILHKANVIQTQTPINPGNSGGPLLLDNGVLIGVNSFKATDSEALNFSVSIGDVKEFLSRNSSRFATTQVAKTKKDCEWKEMYKGKSDDGKSDVISYDTTCSGQINLEIVAPLNEKEPYLLRMDRNGDKRTDVCIYSFNRDMKWDLSYWDDDYDGNWDNVGFHSDGEPTPKRFESYSSFRAKLSQRK